MTYLSRLILNPRNRLVQSDLANCHGMHRTVMRAFPQTAEPGAREQFGILYRLESRAGSGELWLLVQSRAEPDWGALAAGYTLDIDGAKPIDRVYEHMTAGTELIFRLRANPTRRVSASAHPADPLRGKRVELQTEEQQLNWLADKARVGGFEILKVDARPEAESSRLSLLYGDQAGPSNDVPDLRATNGNKSRGWKRATDGGRDSLAFGAVLFDGRLRVSDGDHFRETLVKGIGPAKAYGFGLLSIAPVR